MTVPGDVVVVVVIGVVVVAGGERARRAVIMPAESGSKRRSKDMEWEVSTFLPAESEYISLGTFLLCCYHVVCLHGKLSPNGSRRTSFYLQNKKQNKKLSD